MIQLVYGSKGTGKTKQMIDLANAAAEKKHGDVVFVTDTDRYIAELKYSIRFTNTGKSAIRTEDGLIGFIEGLLAGNYDIRDMFIDGAMRILGVTAEGLESFVTRLDAIAKAADVSFVISISAGEAELPKFLSKYIAK